MQLAATDGIRQDYSCHTLKTLPLLCIESPVRLGLFLEKLYYGCCQLYVLVGCHPLSRYPDW